MKEDYTLLCERKAAFETNSSSSHSLVIDANSPLMTQKYIESLVSPDGKIHIYCGEYGWEIEEFFDPLSKMRYLYTYCNGDESLETELAEAIKEFTGYDVEYERSKWGYIDHQSVDKPSGVFREGKQAILDFVFRSGSYFKTDNDNH